jgi:cytochrome c oxidase subunit IV
MAEHPPAHPPSVGTRVPASHHGHDHGEHGEEGGHHIVPIPLYLTVFAALMVLLVITLVAAYFDLGEWNVIIAITIAVVKALLIVLFFMHVRWSTSLVRVFAGASLFWLTILTILIMQDYLTRPGPTLPG